MLLLVTTQTVYIVTTFLKLCSLIFYRQKEALKNAVEAFQEEKAAHIELYEKQQRVRADQNIDSLYLSLQSSLI